MKSDVFGQPRTRAMGACMICLTLIACEMPPQQSSDTAPEPGVIQATRNGPADAAPGTCWGRTVSPAVIETIREQVQVEPAKVNPDGTIAKPPVYRSQERQRIITPRQDTWFETPCEADLTPTFISSLQRALQARGVYTDAITGVLDDPTRKAIQTFQRIDGPDSSVLSLAMARQLGLIAVERDTSE